MRGLNFTEKNAKAVSVSINHVRDTNKEISMKRTIKAFAFPLILVCMLFCFTATAGAAVDLDNFQTPAEASNWERTTSSQEVIDFLTVVAAESNGRIIFNTMDFKTEAGTPIPYMIISDKAPASPAEVDPDKAVVYVNCNIHSGEIEGKESMMIFAREVAQGKHDELLKDLVIKEGDGVSASVI